MPRLRTCAPATNPPDPRCPCPSRSCFSTDARCSTRGNSRRCALLIVVTVVLDLVKKIDAQTSIREY
jgi:hypothetical protein